MAWPVASGVPMLIMGCGGGFSLIRFLRIGKGDRAAALVMPGISDGLLDATKGDRPYIWALFLLCAPFYLNDFSNMYVSDWRLWIFIDYTSVKLLPLLVALGLIRTGRMRLSEFGWTAHTATCFASAFFIGTLTVTFIVQNGDLFLSWLPDYLPLGKMPEIDSTLWRWIDLTIGLLMVGICEELVFRGYLYTFISRYTRSSWIVISASAMAFGFIHWSAGLHMVIVAAAAGAVFMLLYIQTRSLPAIMLAHFAVDFVDVACILPRPVLIP